MLLLWVFAATLSLAAKLPNNEALQAAGDFINCAYYKNYLSMDYSLVGHQQLIATLSPGEKLQSLIKTWPHWKEDLIMKNRSYTSAKFEGEVSSVHLLLNIRKVYE
ncbi:unnamed protein product [Danaus chrysippus]|uniref:(African queen) hypothetical protein n=1 Tax=Danaus chrysippus TaxID=151541 RepID=A0A8J2VVW4_9NEOP|nr:unnamed protein product [Danaus chrysippus]